MFQDLAVLINDQGQQLQTIDTQIAATAERTREGQQELVKAERSQRATPQQVPDAVAGGGPGAGGHPGGAVCLMLWLVAGLVLAVILVVLFA